MLNHLRMFPTMLKRKMLSILLSAFKVEIFQRNIFPVKKIFLYQYAQYIRNVFLIISTFGSGILVIVPCRKNVVCIFYDCPTYNFKQACNFHFIYLSSASDESKMDMSATSKEICCTLLLYCRKLCSVMLFKLEIH